MCTYILVYQIRHELGLRSNNSIIIDKFQKIIQLYKVFRLPGSLRCGRRTQIKPFISSVAERLNMSGILVSSNRAVECVNPCVCVWRGPGARNSICLTVTVAPSLCWLKKHIHIPLWTCFLHNGRNVNIAGDSLALYVQPRRNNAHPSGSLGTEQWRATVCIFCIF